MDQVFEILKSTRESKGWNKSQMAKELDISSQLYGQYETGKKKPGVDFFIKWRQKFNTDLMSNETKVSKEPLEVAIENLSISKVIDSRNMERLILLLEAKLGVKPDMSMFPTPGGATNQTLTQGQPETNSKKR